MLKRFINALVRKKPIEKDGDTTSRLVRCLTTFDLTALGIGSTLGLGVYVLAGHVAYKQAGPSVVISFIIAAIASVFAGLCYAEFGARVPKAGSAYVYSYTTVGEFMAFVIGWNLILEYVIGTASVARGYSGYVDTLVNNQIGNFFNATLPINVPEISPYFDFFAFGLCLFISILLAFGVKESTNFNAIFTVVNLYAVFYSIIAGAFRADINNWFIPKDQVPPGFGKGGFFPYGFEGVMAGAATCFYGFVGFDAIASTGEESKNPQKSIPLSIVISLTFILISYLGVAAVSTLMAPYWLQGSNAPLTDIFAQGNGWEGSRYIITFGALTSLSTALLGSLFPLPRVLFAMSSDGLLPKTFRITVGLKRTPVFSTLFAGIFAGLMAAIFTTDELTDMMSIGTLLAYTLVAISVLILRYREDPNDHKILNTDCYNEDEAIDAPDTQTIIVPIKRKTGFFNLLFNLEGYRVANSWTSYVSSILITLIVLVCLIIDTILVYFFPKLIKLDYLTIGIVSSMFVMLIILGFLLYLQPTSQTKVSFKVPLLPGLPIVSVLFNFYLMYNLSMQTWYRFMIWMIVGLSLYFLFSIWNSNGYLSQEEKNEKILQDSSSSNKSSDENDDYLPNDDCGVEKTP